MDTLQQMVLKQLNIHIDLETKWTYVPNLYPLQN
jgi:hypothetical protein